MKKIFTIHEVSELLGLSSDAIRLYEKKGLITPIRDASNGYRYYSVDDIHRIAAISLYRKMGIGIAEINALFDKDDLMEISSTFEEMLKDNHRKMELLKKQEERLKNIKSSVDMLSEHEGKYSIAELSEKYILHHQDSISLNYRDMKDVFRSVVYPYGNFRYVIEKIGPDSYMGKSFEFVVDSSVLQLTEWGKLSEYMDSTRKCKCIYTVCSKNRIDTTPWDFKMMQQYIKENGLKCQGEAYAFYMYSIIAGDKFKDYYEVYVPIEE